MLSRSEPQQVFSDGSIRQFLLGRLRGKDQSAFERALFLDSELEQRTRLEEVALADDYVTRKLRGKDLTAFIEKFSFSAARRNQIEVSTALSECFAPEAEVQSAKTWLTPAHPVWKLALATMILIMLFATIWVATKEPRIAWRFVPHRNRPAAVATPTSQVAHHPTETSAPRTHREDSPAPPSHEAATSAIALDSMTTQENAPTVMLAAVRDQNVHVELILSEAAQSSYIAELLKTTGEVVYREAEIAAGDTDRVSFDIPIEHLAAGDFQIRLTRTSDGKQTSYFLRVK
jgi:hypothetical protein